MLTCSLRKIAPLLTTTSAFSLRTSTTALRPDSTASGTSVALSTSALPMTGVYGSRLESQACNLGRGSVRRDAWSCDQGPREASNRRTGPSTFASRSSLLAPRNPRALRSVRRLSRSHAPTTDVGSRGTMWTQLSQGTANGAAKRTAKRTGGVLVELRQEARDPQVFAKR